MPDIINILHTEAPAIQWRTILQEIRTGIDNYERDRLDGHLPEQIVVDHLNPILPKYWDVFHTHNTARRRQGLLPDSCYDVGIFLVGFSSIPIALSLAEIQPRERIYFLYSRDTEDTLSEIADRIRAMLDDSNPVLVDLVEDTVLNLDTAALEIDNPSDPVETFRRIKEIIDQVGEKRIALDLTGGKKTMIGGGFTAGAIFSFVDCDMFYIDSLKYDPYFGAPVPGTEFLTQLENPYDIYNVQSTLEAEKLFKEHNYKEAADLWKGIKKKLKPHYTQFGLKTEYDEAVKHYSRANCYHHWDAFYYEDAKDRKENHGTLWGYDQKHKHRQIDVLNILNAVSNRATLFNNDAHIIHYAVDRYQNAIRRKETGKLEDAIVRFTQVIEMLCNYRVYGNLLNSDNEQVEIPPDTRWELKPLIQFLFRVGSLKYSYYTFLYSYNCDLLLNIDDYDYTVTEIEALIDFRNDFIHVNSPMRQQETEENTEKLQNLARQFLRSFSRNRCESHRLNFDSLLELHEFQKE